MLRNFVLQPNEDKRLQIEGKYLVVTQATGPLELTLGGTLPITVDEKDRIYLRSDSPNDRAMRIKNVSGGVNTIELHTSDLLIDKRTGVNIENSISIQDDQLVGIDPGANIVQAVVQNPIKIDANGNVIKIADDQCVGIDPNKNIVKAEILNKVGIHPDHNDVDATIKNAVEIKRTQKEHIALGALVFEPQEEIVEPWIDRFVLPNPNRESLILTADPMNPGPIWMGGIPHAGTPIYPGDRLFVEANNKLFFIAPELYTLYLSEIIIKDVK